ncbi:hypothetical protein EEZ25_27070 [Micromonospora aurantiaca]|uniref:hypothetical protein n=1 Tax=Micromonospora aurantiaca (nom. illeg.) TaxID=47850 RepID=UPI000F3C61C1|nr:hypothetical protein [Micromonospora aurantiaca]RNH98228.1 hypothetical protein EEZ25_27070 [Micromonospora aurantiaca]
MADTTVIAARRYSDQHPGYRLAYAGEAAVPVSLLTLDVLAQERKRLPLVDEFVLRLADHGIHKIDNMAAVLGIDTATVSAAVTAQMSAETVEYRPDSLGGRKVLLTQSGRRAVEELSTVTPQRVEYSQAFDRMLWQPIPHGRADLVTRADAESQGMRILPSFRTADVDTSDVSPRRLNLLLDQAQQDNGRPAIEVLSVEAITRQPRLFLPAVLLVFASDTADDLRFNIVVDDMLSEHHDSALHQVGGVERTKIQVAPAVGEPDLPSPLRQQRIPYDAVRDLQRRADNPPPRDDSTPGTASTGVKEHESVTARSALEALTVRSVPLFEHRELLTTALNTARTRLLLAAPFVRDAVVNGDFLAKLEIMLRRSGLSAHIGYGLGQDPAHSDDNALSRLRALARRYPLLKLAYVPDFYPNVLIFDDTWVNSGFEWLSFRDQPTRTYRPEEGTLVRDKAHVDERYNHYAELITRADAVTRN